MNEFRTLTRVLFKNGAMPSQAGNSRNKITLMIVAAAFLPLLCLEGVALWNAYGTIASSHLTGAVLTGLLTAACAAMVLFGILYVISTYYFADDTVLLLTMPIPSHRILAAKFVVVLLFQYWIELLIVLPVLLIFGIRGGNLFYWANAVLVFALLPLLPTVICSIVSILVMAFSRFFRNKDRVKFIAGLFAVVFAVGIGIPIQMFSGRSSVDQALLDSGELMQKAAVLFPSNLLAARAVLDGTAVSFLWLAALLLLSAAALAAFLLLGNRLYMDGVVGLTQSTVRKKNMQEGFRMEKCPPALAITLKDWRLLCRTPAFALNCLLSAFLVPLILVFTFAFTLRGVAVPQAGILTVSVGVLMLTFVSMMNAVSPTAISRDGRDAVLARLVPVRFEMQIVGKLLPGLGLSFAALLLTAVPVCILFKPDFFTATAVCGLSAIALITFNMFGLFVDIAFPKLDWDDETTAVKQNLNVAIELFAMLAALGLSVFLTFRLQLNLQNGTAFLLIYNLVLLAVAAWLLFQKGPELYGSGLYEKTEKKSVDHRKMIRGIASVVIVLAVFGFVGWEFFFVHTDVKVTASQVTISAGPGESSSFSLSEIQSVALKDSLPNVSGKIGFASGAQMRGSFIVEGLGRGHVYTQNAKGPFLVVTLRDGDFTIFNFDDTDETNNLYNTLKKFAVEAS